MAYEDVDYCLRAWQAGYRASCTGRERSCTTSSRSPAEPVVTERERASQRVFWSRWGEQLRRSQRPNRGRGVTGRVRDRGHRRRGRPPRHLRAPERPAAIADTRSSCGRLGSTPDWFPLRAPVRSFEDYDDLVAALEPIEAIKVATWWTTAAPVWRASVVHGIPAYFVQDIETSYYPDDERKRHAVLASYQHEFRYMTISSWNRDRLRELGLDAALIPPGHRPRQLPPAGGGQASRRHDSGARSLEPAEEPAADIVRLARAARAPPRARAVRDRARAGRRAWGHATSPLRPTTRSTVSSTKPLHSCRPPPTRASACRRWRRWQPARRSSVPTRTATGTSALMSSTA